MNRLDLHNGSTLPINARYVSKELAGIEPTRDINIPRPRPKNYTHISYKF